MKQFGFSKATYFWKKRKKSQHSTGDVASSCVQKYHSWQFAQRRIASEGKSIFTWWCGARMMIWVDLNCTFPCQKSKAAEQSVPHLATARRSVWPQRVWGQRTQDESQAGLWVVDCPLTTCIETVWGPWITCPTDVETFPLGRSHLCWRLQRANRRLWTPVVCWRWLQQAAGERLGRCLLSGENPAAPGVQISKPRSEVLSQ